MGEVIEEHEKSDEEKAEILKGLFKDRIEKIYEFLSENYGFSRGNMDEDEDEGGDE